MDSYIDYVTKNPWLAVIKERHKVIKRVSMGDWGILVDIGDTVCRNQRFVMHTSLDRTREKFLEYARKWREETMHLSTIKHITMNDNYLDIIGMGMEVVPYILEDLKTKPDHWFVALKHITKENPISAESQGNIKKMAAAWLEWGKSKRII